MPSWFAIRVKSARGGEQARRATGRFHFLAGCGKVADPRYSGQAKRRRPGRAVRVEGDCCGTIEPQPETTAMAAPSDGGAVLPAGHFTNFYVSEGWPPVKGESQYCHKTAIVRQNRVKMIIAPRPREGKCNHVFARHTTGCYACMPRHVLAAEPAPAVPSTKLRHAQRPHEMVARGALRDVHWGIYPSPPAWQGKIPASVSGSRTGARFPSPTTRSLPRSSTW